MSASLVGSEMCIRDSCTLTPESSRSTHAIVLNYAEGPLYWPTHAAPRAVSYTHLTLPTICSV
eukprot:14451784-Alexandrium_andersonii.AAC.1